MDVTSHTQEHVDISDRFDAAVLEMRAALASYSGSDALMFDIEKQADAMRFQSDLADTMDECDWQIMLAENLAMGRVFDWLKENRPDVLLDAHAALGAEADAAFADHGNVEIAA